MGTAGRGAPDLATFVQQNSTVTLTGRVISSFNDKALVCEQRTSLSFKRDILPGRCERNRLGGSCETGDNIFRRLRYETNGR